METVMSHELTAAPLSLFNDDGSMRKTTKAIRIKAVIEEIQ